MRKQYKPIEATKRKTFSKISLPVKVLLVLCVFVVGASYYLEKVIDYIIHSNIDWVVVMFAIVFIGFFFFTLGSTIISMIKGKKKKILKYPNCGEEIKMEEMNDYFFETSFDEPNNGEDDPLDPDSVGLFLGLDLGLPWNNP